MWIWLSIHAITAAGVSWTAAQVREWASCQIRKITGMPGRFSPSPRVSDPDMHHGTCVTHVPWSMPWSLTSGFLWSRWWGKRFRHSRRMHNTQFYVSGKRPMETSLHSTISSRMLLLILALTAMLVHLISVGKRGPHITSLLDRYQRIIVTFY